MRRIVGRAVYPIRSAQIAGSGALAIASRRRHSYHLRLSEMALEHSAVVLGVLRQTSEVRPTVETREPTARIRMWKPR